MFSIHIQLWNSFGIGKSHQSCKIIQNLTKNSRQNVFGRLIDLASLPPTIININSSSPNEIRSITFSN